MKIITITENINCYLALYQSCRKYNIEYFHYRGGNLEVDPTDVLLFLESNPIGLYNILNCNTINGFYFYYDKFDKYKQYQIIKAAGINHIPTYTFDEVKDIDFIPFVSKPKYGSMGIGIELLYSKHILSPNNIFQPPIRNDGDWRIIVIGEKAVSSIKRYGSGFLNNIAQGAYAWSDWDNEAVKLAEEAAKALEIEYAGIDIIKDLDTGKYLFLECNSTPVFDTSQILTGINIADELVKYIIKNYGTTK